MVNVSVTTSNVIAQSESGGAALDQVFGMTAAAAVVSLFLLYLAFMHRTRRITWLARLADYAGSKLNLPGWAALPLVLFVSTILTAFFGFIWDVSLHIGRGRDEGPLANPAHYFILVGLFFLFIAGALAIILPLDEKPGRAAVKITRTWYAPTGGLLIAGSGLYALIGFPLDDIWHRIFGQDVTLWGPTHLMLIGGAGLSLIGVLLLEHEGRLALAAARQTSPDEVDEFAQGPRRSVLSWILKASAFGGLLIGLSVFQIEFDFGVEQFRLVFQPMLIVGAGAFALVAARLVVGRGATLFVVAFAAVIRELTAFVVGPVLGEPHNVFALFLGIAVVVELVGLTPLVVHRLRFGMLAGFAAATVGLWLESLWIDAVFVYPWPTSMWVEALAMAIPVGVMCGLTAGLFAQLLSGDGLPAPAVRRTIVVALVLVLGGATANGLMIDVPENATATVTLADAAPQDGGRMVTATVRLDPADLVSDDPEWVAILAWQGAGDTLRGLVVDRLERTGPGMYQSTRPVPAHGTWKTFLRIQDGRTLTGTPIFMAADPGIGASEVSADAQFTRQLQSETALLQRERSFDHPAWLFGAASLVVLVCTLALIWALSWGAVRISTETPGASVSRRTLDSSSV
ncbi:hypothetical protein CH262_20125 [Rhodococcus sp. 05-2255-1e]|uniref:hypothetical protein n=1 Tax=Rhodococcus sp. 05-2255-1e TaxID=2022495 RepID=UPI000B9ADCF5|nr:hypothetical protein [Rhodococcus sp. 05-2255-1e]OZE21633.1 hypothetical protein CH262_20125 [Rhodococcus sp. 05-2255-1e]